MTDRRAALLALAIRCEAAAEDSRELDAEIDAALHGGTPSHLCINSTRRGYGAGTVHARDALPVYSDGLDWRDAPAVTASLDAALTLVPEQYGWTVTQPHGQPADAVVGGYHQGYAATPALAICAAALRARAAMEPER